jgi:AcrR family transcriptional regulator
MAARQAGSDDGRVAQKRRTRAAIVGATKQLLADGQQPSIDDIATAADVSRRTIYMYFPTLDQLLVDASSGLLSERTIEPVLDAGTMSTDPVRRVDEYAAALLAMAPEALPNARRILRLTVDTEQRPENERRGYRRIEWLGRVLEPLRDTLPEPDYERLRAALAALLGWEAMIVLQDSLGLDWDETERVHRWAAGALVAATVDEQTS